MSKQALSLGAKRVLKLARSRGARGVHSSDFDVPGHTADGGKPIRRLAARIEELHRIEGHVFEPRRRRDRTVDYVLVFDAPQLALVRPGPPTPEADDGSEVADEQLLLLTPPPVNAILGDWDAA